MRRLCCGSGCGPGRALLACGLAEGAPSLQWPFQPWWTWGGDHDRVSPGSEVWSPESLLGLLPISAAVEETAEKRSANAFLHLIPRRGFDTVGKLLLPNLVTHSVKVPVINAVLIFIE